jgi:alpha-glucoside transport system permease protein
MNDQVITILIAVVGVPLLLVGYLLATEVVVGAFPNRWQSRIRPYLWIFPAVAFATVFMVIPTLNTIVLSFQNRNSTQFVGLDNYQYFFTNPTTSGALKNSVLWLIFFTSGVVIFGLLIAVIFDRVRYESAAKLAVFLPIPISAVAASIIWKFMFEYQPEGQVQTGTLNALIGVVGLGPVAWLVESATNNAALIFVGIWISTGFAMVIISSSLKGISPELFEAARLDGASEVQVLRRIIVPMLLPTLTVVTTTMIIVALKVFDIVYVLTAGAYDTDVIASQMFSQLTGAGHYGRASAVGVILLIAVIPLLVINVRRFRREEQMR